MRIAVYSCYFGNPEPYTPDAMGAGHGYDRILFTDRPDLEVAEGVRREVLTSGDAGAIAASRLPKLCPHKFMSGYDWVIYVDNRARLRVDPAAFVAAIEARFPEGAPRTRYAFRHDRTQCIYREIKACQRMGYMTLEAREALIAAYRAEGLPSDAGLFVNTAMVQRMGDPAADAFNEGVFDHVTRVTRRDQIGFAYKVWREQFPLVVLEEGLADVVEWPLYSFRTRRRFQREAA